MTAKRIKLEAINTTKAGHKLSSENKHMRIVKELEKQMSRNQNYMDFYQRDVNNILEEIRITDQVNLNGTWSRKAKRN